MNPARVGFDPGVVMLFSISNFSLHSLYCSKACNELTGPISALMHQRTTKLLSKRYRSGGEPAMFDLTGSTPLIWTSNFLVQRWMCYRLTNWRYFSDFSTSAFSDKNLPTISEIFFLSFSTGSGASRIVTGGRSQPNRDRNNLGGASSN